MEEKSKHTTNDPGIDGVLSDLRAFERALEAASSDGVRFHFWVG
jgi:hypothetical protein